MWNKVWCFCNEPSLTMIQTFRVWRRQSEAERTVQMNKIHSDTWVSLTAVRYRNCMNTKCVCITVLEGIENVAAPFELSSSVMYDAFRCFLWMCCWQRCSTEQTERSSLNIYSLRQMSDVDPSDINVWEAASFSLASPHQLTLCHWFPWSPKCESVCSVDILPSGLVL